MAMHSIAAWCLSAGSAPCALTAWCVHFHCVQDRAFMDSDSDDDKPLVARGKPSAAPAAAKARA